MTMHRLQNLALDLPVEEVRLLALKIGRSKKGIFSCTAAESIAANMQIMPNLVKV